MLTADGKKFFLQHVHMQLSVFQKQASFFFLFCISTCAKKIIIKPVYIFIFLLCVTFISSHMYTHTLCISWSSQALVETLASFLWTTYWTSLSALWAEQCPAAKKAGEDGVKRRDGARGWHSGGPNSLLLSPSLLDKHLHTVLLLSVGLSSVQEAISAFLTGSYKKVKEQEWWRWGTEGGKGWQIIQTTPLFVLLFLWATEENTKQDKAESARFLWPLFP